VITVFLIYTIVQKFGVSKRLFKEINTFIQLRSIKLKKKSFQMIIIGKKKLTD